MGNCSKKYMLESFSTHIKEENIQMLRNSFPALTLGFTNDMEFKMLFKKRNVPL